MPGTYKLFSKEELMLLVALKLLITSPEDGEISSIIRVGLVIMESSKLEEKDRQESQREI